ncbi:MAG: hypothetical protein ACP5O8_02555 [Candidatus Aenigmatarchaeota archaeon]
MAEEKVKIKISKNLVIFLLLALIFILAIAYFKISEYKPLTAINYEGFLLQFRADLREANKLEADKEAIEEILWDKNVKNITIIFTNSSDLELVGVESFEIAYKLGLAYRIKGYDVEIKGKELSYPFSFDSLPKPSIVLIPPSLSDKTGIEVRNSSIIISGKNKEEFDLATVKFLIIALGLEFS